MLAFAAEDGGEAAEERFLFRRGRDEAERALEAGGGEFVFAGEGAAVSWHKRGAVELSGDGDVAGDEDEPREGAWFFAKHGVARCEGAEEHARHCAFCADDVAVFELESLAADGDL